MTPASIRALIAASDGSDQGEILRQAYKALLGVDWSDDYTMRADSFYAFIGANAHTEAALLIAEAALPGCDYMPGTTDAGKGGGCIIRLADGHQITSETLRNGTPAIDAVCAAKAEATP